MNKKIRKILGIAGVGLAAGVAAGALAKWLYEKDTPKPTYFGKQSHPVHLKKLTVPMEGRELYGELLTPADMEGPLPTLICCHGYNGTYRSFTHGPGMMLARSGFCVYCFDFFGGSEHSRSGGTVADMLIGSECDDLRAVMDALKEQPMVDASRLYLWGESQGGLVAALTAADRAEDVAGLILVYPAFCAPEDMRRRVPDLENMPEEVRIFDIPVSRALCEELWGMQPYAVIGRYTGPVLIIHGDADPIVGLQYSRWALGCYQNARLEVLPGEQHGFTPDGTALSARMIYEFLRGSDE